MKAMKALFIPSLILISMSSAFADGFVCQTRSNDLVIKVYDNIEPSQGTRTAAVLVLSDPGAQPGSETLARFTSVKGLLTNHGSFYQANVDLRFKDQRDKEALVAGRVQLQQLNTIELSVDFDYTQPVQPNDILNGEIVLNSRAGDRITMDVTCERYLKN